MSQTIEKKRKPRFNQRDRKNEFINAAKTLFERQGIDKTTIREIAKEAGASIGLLFEYFPSKDDLILEIVRERGEFSLNEVNNILSQEKKFAEIIKDFFEFQYNYHTKFYESQKVLLSLSLKDMSTAKKWGTIIEERRIEPISNFLKKKISTGEINEYKDINAVSRTIISITYYISFISRYIIGMDEKTCRNELSTAAEILIHSLLRKTSK